jgi:hypothetical protein
MMKPGVQSARIDHIRKAELPDPAQALKPWMFNDVEDQFAGNIDESIDGIIENFFLVHLYFIRHRKGLFCKAALFIFK